MDNRWSAEALAGIKATPWSQREIPEVGVTFKEPATATDVPAEEARPALPRRLKLYPRDFERYGFTDRCKQCIHIQAHGAPKPGMQHNDTCRSRILHEMGRTPAGQERLARHEGNIDRAFADIIADEDKKQPASNSSAVQAASAQPDNASPDNVLAGGNAVSNDPGPAARGQAAPTREPWQALASDHVQPPVPMAGDPEQDAPMTGEPADEPQQMNSGTLRKRSSQK